MGNSKSKKMKITQSDTTKAEECRERINSIKTESPDVNSAAIRNNDMEMGSEQNEEKSNDNASSASTVEVLDDK
ncbi:unnamed protein product [Colias eurytheme]|nr:unnamed protein product [Colias eurytheme]